MTQTVDGSADRELKARQRAVWALGDYAAVATEVIPALGPILVDACDLRPGDRVLDVAAGTGNAALPAARAGADVLACDLTPELLERGRRAAASEGLALQWQEADAEALPFADGEFDVVLSCVGVMFAPSHDAAVAQLLRVCRPGGTIGLLSWTPEGFLGRMLATMKPYAPPPPPGSAPPPLWGREEHVRALLGERVTGLRMQRGFLVVDCFATPEDFLAYFKANYGPTIATYRSMTEPDREAALDEALRDLATRHARGAGRLVMEWEYLLVTARRR